MKNIALEWISLGPLTEEVTDFSKYNKDIGIYRVTLNDAIVYIGKATELSNGGFRKRLRDYTRSSDSARNYPSGRMLFQHKGSVCIDILIFERKESNIPIISQLEEKLIADINPIWNMLDA